ncbi:MAG: hypothetical protein Q9201_005055 [Fulgogasparrea decipioides]
MADAVPYRDFIDPNFNWGYGPPPDGPHPPGRPPKTNRECKRQMVWPRDKDQKGAHCWRRWKDVFSNKGPSIWVRKQGDDGPHRNAWTHWAWGDEQLPDNLGYRDNRDAVFLGNPDTEKKYDFRSRRYVIPHDRVLSDVKWDRRGRDILYSRNRFGHKETHAHILMKQDPAEKRLRLLYGYDPFDYNPYTPHWDWHFDELPFNWQPLTADLWNWEEW